SWNCGVEGLTTDPGVNELRSRQVRNLMLTLLLSQGVPMLQAGDEVLRTQDGNNNAYCQDNQLTWINWDLDDERRGFLEFTKRIIALRAAEPVFRRRSFFQGRPITGDIKELYWVSAAGHVMQPDVWNSTCAV